VGQAPPYGQKGGRSAINKVIETCAAATPFAGMGSDSVCKPVRHHGFQIHITCFGEMAYGSWRRAWPREAPALLAVKTLQMKNLGALIKVQIKNLLVFQ